MEGHNNFDTGKDDLISTDPEQQEFMQQLKDAEEKMKLDLESQMASLKKELEEKAEQQKADIAVANEQLKKDLFAKEQFVVESVQNEPENHGSMLDEEEKKLNELIIKKEEEFKLLHESGKREREKIIADAKIVKKKVDDYCQEKIKAVEKEAQEIEEKGQRIKI